MTEHDSAIAAPGQPMHQIIDRKPDEKFCTQCGQPIHAMAEICPKCGVRQFVAYPGKNKVVAALLGIFLGGFGIHKFYLNRPIQGLIYLLFFWAIIPAILGFIEGILYLTMSDAAFAAKYR